MKVLWLLFTLPEASCPFMFLLVACNMVLTMGSMAAGSLAPDDR